MKQGIRMPDSQETPKCFAYMFEAKGIERYIMHSGMLRDIVAASDLVAIIAKSDGEDDLIGEVLAKLDGKKVWTFSRRAGGAFCVHDGQDDLVALRARWRARIFLELPGLGFTDAIAHGATDIEAMRACFAAMGGIRHNTIAEALPHGRSITLYAARTALPVMARRWYPDDQLHISGDLDVIAAPQRDYAEPPPDKPRAHAVLSERFTSKGALFPRNFDDDTKVGDRDDSADNPAFPWRDGNSDRRWALIHADLSGLGVLFRKLNPGDAESNCASATAIEDAITKAVKATSDAVLPVTKRAYGSVVPARPVLLGGDDITITIRADLAFRYAKMLLEQIEEQTKAIGAEQMIALSACAGIAIVGPKTPWFSANALAHSLCRLAKTAVKAGREITAVKAGGEIKDQDSRMGYASALAFYVQTQSAIEDADTIARNHCDADGNPLWGNPYTLGQRYATGLNTVATLERLCGRLMKPGAGLNRVRTLQAMRTRSIVEADSGWRRWREVAPKDVPISQDGCPNGASGLFDAAVLVNLGSFDAVPPVAANADAVA